MFIPGYWGFLFLIPRQHHCHSEPFSPSPLHNTKVCIPFAKQAELIDQNSSALCFYLCDALGTLEQNSTHDTVSHSGLFPVFSSSVQPGRVPELRHVQMEFDQHWLRVHHRVLWVPLSVLRWVYLPVFLCRCGRAGLETDQSTTWSLLLAVNWFATSRLVWQVGWRMLDSLRRGGQHLTSLQEGHVLKSCSPNQVMGAGKSHPQCLCTASCCFILQTRATAARAKTEGPVCPLGPGSTDVTALRVTSAPTVNGN